MPNIYDHSCSEPVVYLDNAASTPLHPGLLASLGAVWRGGYVNPSSGHAAGHALRRNLSRLTAEFLETLGAGEDRVIWTSGGTEANNLAIFGSLPLGGNALGFQVLSSAAEHPSIHAPLEHLAENGALISHTPVKSDGALDLERFATELRPETRLVSLSFVQNETGVIQDLPVIRRLIDQYAPQARFHVDGVQALGKIPIPWQEARIDLLSFSSHKVHGPGGLGGLVVRGGLELQPIIFGGGQQHNLRSGSLDGAGIAGFCLALRLLREEGDLFDRVSGLNRQLRAGLARLTGREGRPVKLKLISPASASPFILNFSLPGYEGAVLMRVLGENGVMVSTGSACSAETNSPSKVLTAMGCSRREAFGALRVSFGHQNTAADAETFLAELQQAILDY